MKNEATINMHVIGNETDKEILEVSKQIISLSKHMDINLKIVRVEPVINTEIQLAETSVNKRDDRLDLYSQYIVDQIMG